MSPELTAVVEPFVRRGLFPNAETAVTEIARDYVLRQIERYRAVEAAFQARYGMTYEQFDDYLRARSKTLSETPSPALNQAIMTEEDDALDWKIARDMVRSWLGLQREEHFPEIASHPHHFHNAKGEAKSSPLTGDAARDLPLVLNILFPSDRT